MPTFTYILVHIKMVTSVLVPIPLRMARAIQNYFSKLNIHNSSRICAVALKPLRYCSAPRACSAGSLGTRLMCWENLAGKHACTTLLCVSNRLGRFAIGSFGCRAISSRNSTYRMEKQCGLCLVLLLLLAAGVRNGLCRRPVLRVPRHAPTTGRYTVVLKQNTSVAELQQVLTRVLRISDGEKVYGYVEKVTKAFTVQLPSYALELVKLHACILVAFSFITQALEEECSV